MVESKKGASGAKVKKLTPQQLNAENEKNAAITMSFEKIVVAVEKSKMKMQNLEDHRKEVNSDINNAISKEKVIWLRYRRFLNYKKESLK